MNNTKPIMVMGWVTLLGFPLVALAVLYFTGNQWQYMFTSGWPVYYQVLLGIACGLVIGLGLRYMLRTRPFADLTTQYSSAMEPFELSRPEFVFLSVCAGVGEEILFRGCIQYFAGIIPTAIAFVALHGYLNPYNAKIMIYGLLLTAVFIGVAYLMEYTGLYTCIVLHIVIDVILFDHLLSGRKRKN